MISPENRWICHEKKCLSFNLALLILINTPGCYSTAYVPKNHFDELSTGDNITIIDEDTKAYRITVERAGSKEIRGYSNSGEPKSWMIQVDYRMMKWMGMGFLFGNSILCKNKTLTKFLAVARLL
jgi:hypothetical protein